MPLDDMTELRKRVPGGKYALTRAVAERARQLQQGETPLVRVESPNPLSVAISEIMEGKVSFTIDNTPGAQSVDGAPAVAAGDAGASLTGGEVAAPDALDEAMAASSRNMPDPARNSDTSGFAI